MIIRKFTLSNSDMKIAEIVADKNSTAGEFIGQRFVSFTSMIFSFLVYFCISFIVMMFKTTIFFLLDLFGAVMSRQFF